MEKYSLVKRDQIQCVCVYLPVVSTHIIPPIAIVNSIDLPSMISHEN